MELDRLNALLSGDKRALAKAITLLESTLTEHKKEAEILVEQALLNRRESVRIGITGVPGVGKSTFIETLGLHLTDSNLGVAVLAVDPSSPVSGGSILGDKTRMENLSKESRAFIRPSPNSGELGGVAQKTREAIILCEAAGYDVILIETVGVGQSEYLVSEMVDFLLVMMLPGGGDELQGLKKGILELADAMVINKSDGDRVSAANISKQQYQSALSLVSHPDYWITPVLTCSALRHSDVTEVWDMIERFFDTVKANGELEGRRQTQNVKWMKTLIKDVLTSRLYTNTGVDALLTKLERSVKEMKMTPYAAANQVIRHLGES